MHVKVVYWEIFPGKRIRGVRKLDQEGAQYGCNIKLSHIESNSDSFPQRAWGHCKSHLKTNERAKKLGYVYPCPY